MRSRLHIILITVKREKNRKRNIIYSIQASTCRDFFTGMKRHIGQTSSYTNVGLSDSMQGSVKSQHVWIGGTAAVKLSEMVLEPKAELVMVEESDEQPWLACARPQPVTVLKVRSTRHFLAWLARALEVVASDLSVSP